MTEQKHIDVKGYDVVTLGPWKNFDDVVEVNTFHIAIEGDDRYMEAVFTKDQFKQLKEIINQVDVDSLPDT